MLSLQVPQQLLQSKVIYTVPRCCHCSWCWWRRRRWGRGRWWWWWWQQVHNALALASCSSSWLSWVCGVLVSCHCLLPWGELRAARSRTACQGYGKPLLRALELHLQHACHQNKQSTKEASQQHSTWLKTQTQVWQFSKLGWGIISILVLVGGAEFLLDISLPISFQLSIFSQNYCQTPSNPFINSSVSICEINCIPPEYSLS